jgi:adrenodoxin-NADP+ reductase
MSEIADRRCGFPWKNPGAPTPHRSLGSFFHHPNRHQFSSIGEAKSNDEVPSDPSPWRVAIVGSGPSGCYTAKYLMMGASSKLQQSRSSLSIDVIERLPTPYGLVRNGVAPDHPEVKNVQNDFDVLFEESESKYNNHEIRFYGNVTVGDSNSDNENTSDVALDELRALYDVVILAYGCESDRELDLPVDVLGEDGVVQQQTETRASDLKGILSAREFVNWYNGHPDYDWVTEEVKDALWKNKKASEQEESDGITTQNIVVVGHGNVALDCARILAKSRDTLDPTDLTTRAIDVLRPQATSPNNNEVQRSISVVGRRGHVQAAFTIKEVRELTKLVETDDAELVVRNDELELGGGTEASKEELKARPRARIHKLLEGHAKQSSTTKKMNPQSPTTTTTTQVHLRFLTNPVRFEATPNDGGNQDQLRLSSVVCERTELEGETPGAQNAKVTGSTETINADLCLVSIGYKGLPIDSSTTASFDTGKGILKNDHGRVVLLEDRGNDNSDETNNLAPLYVSGWLKRGPSGIIGTNIGDAKDTVVSILNDLESGVITKPSLPSSSSSSSPLEELLQERKIRFVEWDAYRRIEQCESSNSENENVVGHRKRHPDQPREKIVDRETLLRAAEADR